MKLLLDTHMLVWLATDRSQLNARELSAIDDEANILMLSSISLWELRAKIRAERRRDRHQLTLDPAGAIMFCGEYDVEIDVARADDAAAILLVEPQHGDPFDEMLLVHAQRLGAKLLTRDRKLLEHPLAF
jgi:PIN domain nuclease of toxin-antitoxin system